MWNSLKLIRELLSRRSTTQRLKKALEVDPANPEIHFNLALAYAAAGQQMSAMEQYRAALAAKPDLSSASFNLALLLKESGDREGAIAVIQQALQAAPLNEEMLPRLRHIMDFGHVPAWHFSMMNDGQRNAKYEQAIRAVVRPADGVLEIGTGAGLLAMLAVRHGARHVVSCEEVVPVALKAREIIKQNGCESKITVIACRSTEVRIPEGLSEPADILIAEIISSDLLGEGILDSYEDARKRLLKPDARIMPCGATIVAQLAGAPELTPFLRVEEVAGFDMRSFNDFTPALLPVDDLGVPLRAYSAAFDVFQFDLQGPDRIQPRCKTLAIPVTETGVCHGVLQWLRLQLCEGVQYENAPTDSTPSPRRGHWRQILHVFRQPLDLEKGQILQLVAAHDRSSLMFYPRPR